MADQQEPLPQAEPLPPVEASTPGGPPPIGQVPVAQAVPVVADYLSRAERRPANLSTTALTLGVISIVFGPFTGLPGLVLGIVALARKHPGKGFAVAGIVCSLVLSMVPVVLVRDAMDPAVRQPYAVRASCSANLNAIGRGLAMYFADNNDRYPLLSDSSPIASDMNAQLSATLHASSVRPFNFGGPWAGTEYGTAPQANIWLLYWQKYMASERTFCCPATRDTPTDRTPPAPLYGFGSGRNISYGIHLPYAQMPDGTHASPLTAKLDGAVAIIADRCDPRRLDRPGPNHRGEGTSVLYHSGAVQWQTKVQTGFSDNNIYRRDMLPDGTVQPSSAAGAWAPAQHPYDSVIVHTNSGR